MAGFWFSLADGSQERLRSYVFEYVKGLGEKMARAMAERMTRSSEDAVRESLDHMQELGCDEVFLVPASSDLAEVERAAELVAARAG